ncbi:toxin-antitoxin system HicB family antitoxin [Candidatus Mycobacterium methanotrophicum]|uniref:Type II toxin-antitoxin system HicB family antitoxin n=1 Tax=Candidatus Mycobacterium methanotrophicum TaxID=2943498 RepID=A0ABY4QMH4_9MYCO|nr:toxin-antitoxin system HicB family antitoxin [Candidatus Mycobacterium methanotrophicum]UQX12074.1 type II toxin-antitoxin system HicB family antitoxin [Candidatus Mycobacterium methanotrophicum]
MNRYTYRAEWSAEHGEYVGRCLELSWLPRWAPTMQQAIADVEQAAEQHVSLNQWAVQKLADRPPTGLFDL